MPFKTAKRAENQKETATFKIDWGKTTIENVRALSTNVASFTLRMEGISLYGMKVVESEKGMFVVPAQSKGNNGKYYNNYAIFLSKEDSELIIDQVCKLLNDDEAEIPFD